MKLILCLHFSLHIGFFVSFKPVNLHKFLHKRGKFSVSRLAAAALPEDLDLVREVSAAVVSADRPELRPGDLQVRSATCQHIQVSAFFDKAYRYLGQNVIFCQHISKKVVILVHNM